MAGSKKS
ncbi:hypothetical protein D047_3704A, partial [Vibrio parahaemolyticus VPTS-2010_2]